MEAAARTDLARGLVDSAARAYSDQDWQAFRRSFHDQALLCTVAAGGRVVGPDELIRVLKAVHDTPYAFGEMRTVEIDEDAAISTGRIRYAHETGGLADSERAWLMTLKDGLIYRMHTYGNVRQAAEAYAEHGIELGMIHEPAEVDPQSMKPSAALSTT